jgi:hypothetical protein
VLRVSPIVEEEGAALDPGREAVVFSYRSQTVGRR